MLRSMVSVDDSLTAPERGERAGKLAVIVADDEQPAVRELAYLLGQDDRIGAIYSSTSGTEVLQLLDAHQIDALFLDIHMPGLSGLDLAKVINKFSRAEQPAIVFVTADEDRAVEAFELAAVDYLLKPVRTERLAESVRRITEQLQFPEQMAQTDDLITVDQGRITKLIRKSEIRYVQAQGDYARLHTADASFLIRVPLSELEEQWQSAGFLRIHRSYLISMPHLSQLQMSRGSASVRIGDASLPVSRRHLPGLRGKMAANRPRSRG